MNFVADESVDQPIVTRLREEGHKVWAIVEMEPSVSDEAVLEIANQQGMVLLTGDKDFGELVFRDRQISLWDCVDTAVGFDRPGQSRDSRLCGQRTWG
jgi:predicted nuclease of predicted toxin-antitoxin system